MDGYLIAAAALVAVGLLLLAAELFVPTGGLMLVSGLTAWAAAVGVVLLYGTSAEASVAVIGLAVGVPVGGAVAVWGWQRAARRVGLRPSEGTSLSAEDASELAVLKGRYGTTVTPMRPSGAVSIDGRRYDALTEGLMLDSGVSVKCVAVKAGRVIVRRADAAGLADLTFDDPA